MRGHRQEIRKEGSAAVLMAADCEGDDQPEGLSVCGRPSRCSHSRSKGEDRGGEKTPALVLVLVFVGVKAVAAAATARPAMRAAVAVVVVVVVVVVPAAAAAAAPERGAVPVLSTAAREARGRGICFLALALALASALPGALVRSFARGRGTTSRRRV